MSGEGVEPGKAMPVGGHGIVGGWDDPVLPLAVRQRHQLVQSIHSGCGGVRAEVVRGVQHIAERRRGPRRAREQAGAHFPVGRLGIERLAGWRQQP